MQLPVNRPLIAIAYNAKSGRHSPKKLDALRAEFAKAGYDTALVDSYSAELIPMAAKSIQLCVVGGDGTLRDVIARITGQDDMPPVSVYPGGTINLVAREALYPANIPKFVARVTGATGATGTLRAHHHGTLNDHPVLVCASVGPDSLAVASVSERLKRNIGRFAYGVALAKRILRWPRHALTVTADGAVYECEAAFILKGRYFAGIWQISRVASLTQPAFQLLLLPRARRRDYIRLMIAASGLRWGCGWAESKEWLRLSAQRIEVRSTEPLPVQADGDIVAHLPIQAVVSPDPVRFI
jgi:diacylglycerol kinase (ATP)